MREGLPASQATKGMTLVEVGFIDSLVQGTVVPLEAEAKRIVRENSLSKVLDMAIQTERDSQDFYRQILAEVDDSGSQFVGAIIEEEIRHEQLLLELRNKIKE
jgi:rubrerythrin